MIFGRGGHTDEFIAHLKAEGARKDARITELERANAGLLNMVAGYQAVRLSVDPPVVSVDQEPPELAELDPEIEAELLNIDDDTERAEFAELARYARTQHPRASADEIIALVFPS